MRGNRKAPAAAVLLLVPAACRPDPDSARGVAEHFLDAHYVRMDLPAARDLAEGAARAKVEQEIALVGEQRIDESTRVPSVTYRLRREESGGTDAVMFLYEARIRPPGADAFSRRWLVTVRRRPGRGWRVTNFVEEGD